MYYIKKTLSFHIKNNWKMESLTETSKKIYRLNIYLYIFFEVKKKGHNLS